MSDPLFDFTTRWWVIAQHVQELKFGTLPRDRTEINSGIWNDAGILALAEILHRIEEKLAGRHDEKDQRVTDAMPGKCLPPSLLLRYAAEQRDKGAA